MKISSANNDISKSFNRISSLLRPKNSPITLPPLYFIILLVLLTVSFVKNSESKPVPDSSSEEDSWWNSKSKVSFTGSKSEDFDFDFDEDRKTMEGLVNIIVGIVVFIIVAFFAFIICLCCPICMLAKMRGRRRRGAVYRTVTANGTTITTGQGAGGTTVVVSAPPSRQAPIQAHAAHLTAASPSVIAISNNANQPSKPYPVQQSVTVVPVIAPQNLAPGYSQPMQYQVMPQAQAQYNPQQQSQYNPQQPHPSDLPPPYPGLPREMDDRNLPYNPYFSESGPSASAPPAFKQ